MNEVITSGLPIQEKILGREEHETSFRWQDYPRMLEIPVRIIVIGDYDLCPCSGVHARTTSEIGGFKIISTDYANNILRIRFKIHHVLS